MKKTHRIGLAAISHTEHDPTEAGSMDQFITYGSALLIMPVLRSKILSAF